MKDLKQYLQEPTTQEVNEMFGKKDLREKCRKLFKEMNETYYKPEEGINYLLESIVWCLNDIADDCKDFEKRDQLRRIISDINGSIYRNL